jgi:shikimate dehydrogenase
MIPPLATTRLLLLLGDPVSHSRSPAMQNAALRALGLDAAYLALRSSAADLPGLLLGVARGGGGGNVTLPHKELAARTVEAPSPDVVRTGACNTFWLEDGVVQGDNTDVEGVRRAVRSLLGCSAGGARILLLGAGGAARGALWALLDDAPERVAIRNRSSERARSWVETIRDPRVELLEPGESTDDRWDLVVQATSLGLHAGDPLPVDPDPERMGAVLDLVYGARPTPLVERARALGIPATDGTEMLLQQGVAAFERWWGRPAPEAVMREALGGVAG